MNDMVTEILTMLFSVGLPALVSWLKSCRWPAWKVSTLAIVVSLLLGTVSVAAEGKTDWQNIMGTAGIIFTAATVIYQKWFKWTDLNRELEQRKVL